jgi:hypothetical protein
MKLPAHKSLQGLRITAVVCGLFLGMLPVQAQTPCVIKANVYYLTSSPHKLPKQLGRGFLHPEGHARPRLWRLRPHPHSLQLHRLSPPLPWQFP